MGDTIEKVSKSSILTKVSILSILAKSIGNSIPLEPAMFLVSIPCFKSYFNKWKKMNIGIDFGIGIDQNSWYRTGIVSKPKKLVSPITIINR
jgi:hypothetical protein